jgi:hypothetical protein
MELLALPSHAQTTFAWCCAQGAWLQLHTQTPVWFKAAWNRDNQWCFSISLSIVEDIYYNWRQRPSVNLWLEQHSHTGSRWCISGDHIRKQSIDLSFKDVEHRGSRGALPSSEGQAWGGLGGWVGLAPSGDWRNIERCSGRTIWLE